MSRVAAGILTLVVLVSAAPRAQESERLFKAAMNTELVDGDLKAAIAQYKKVAESRNRSLAAQALVRLAECYQKLGDAEAQKVYERLVRDFADQTDAVATARSRLPAIRPVNSDPEGQTARRLWRAAAVGAEGTLTADGRYLTFQDGDTGDLAVRDFVTNTSRRLTNTGGWAASGDYSAQSVISSDGRRIAYHWFIEKEGSNELRMIALSANETSSPRVLLKVEPREYLIPVALTPDGAQVVVIKTLADKTNQLGLVSTSNGSYRSIKSLEWRYPRGASLSPDGRYVAYDVPAGDAGSPRDIFLLALDGSRETAGVSGPGDDLQPLWTSDGSHLVFMSDRSGTPSLWSVAIEAGRAAGTPVMLKANTGRIIPMGISKAGALYYAVTGASRRNVYAAALENLKVAGNPSLATEQFVNESSGPSWSPDGRFLAFFSFRGRPTLVIRSVSTGAERTVAVPLGLQSPFFAGPRWFPDGRSVLVLAADPQGSGRAFYRVSVETGAAEPLNHTDRRISSYALSPNGRTIFWSVQSVDDDSPPRGELVRYDITEKRETILKSGEWFITVAISPDGAELAYLKSTRTDEDRRKHEYPSVVEVIPATGGTARQVFRDPVWLTGVRYNTLSWTPDGRFLMFVRDDRRLWRAPASGGEPEDMGLSTPGRIKSPSIHPDGTRIVFGTQESDENEIWAFEKILPVTTTARR